ncbi:dynactin subunit 3 [Megalopta genalis]|uniref:dynactin subunit 3 n=1 Tax=Megalopta genalis TaxID=115081 RepID=UPI00144370A9|nr:dynactin subunit 3-like [Megalopta genalis]XP_033333620.1 dynactin subunit 3-like [Megalopta genalis]
MTTVELLESRITELEKRVFGYKEASGNNNTPPENPVIHSLLDVNTLVSSAMSGRKNANMVIQRLPELNRYLDPVADSTELPIEAKLQLLLTMAPEIKQNCDMLHQMQELMPVLETDRIRDVPELSNKLNDLNLSYLKIYEESQDLNGHINEVFSKYNEVITSISKSLITIDAAVTAAEIAAMPKKQVD